VYSYYESSDALRCADLFGHGKAFCAGADRNEIKDTVDIADASSDRMDPFQLAGPTLSKPLVVAAHGACVGSGLELALAGDSSWRNKLRSWGNPKRNAESSPSVAARYGGRFASDGATPSGTCSPAIFSTRAKHGGSD
jgi:hypothetical protein